MSAGESLPSDSHALPWVLLLESVAQLGGFAWLGAEPGAGAFLAGVKDALFSRPAIPGDTVDVRVQVVRAVGPIARIHGSAQIDGDEALRAEVTLARWE